MGLLFVALGAGLFYYLQILLYRKCWKKGLCAEVAFAEQALMEKEAGHVTEVITNRKLLPLSMLRVKFQVNKNIKFEGEENISISDRCYKNDIFSIMLYQKITRTLNFTASKRGYYPIDQIDLISSDIFMNDSLVWTVPCHSVLTVYPAFVDVSKIIVPYQKVMGTVLAKRNTYEDPFEFRSIRPYEQYDRMKDINWKASAKTGELKVNVHDYTTRQEIILILNLDTDTVLEYDRLREESIRILHTLADRFVAQGIPVGVYGNGCDVVTGENLRISCGSGANHFMVIRERLARLVYEQTYQQGELLLKECGQNNGENTVYVLISTAHRQSLQEGYQKLCTASRGSLWILPVHPDMDSQIQCCSGVQTIRWEVENVED